MYDGLTKGRPPNGRYIRRNRDSIRVTNRDELRNQIRGGGDIDECIKFTVTPLNLLQSFKISRKESVWANCCNAASIFAKSKKCNDFFTTNKL